MKENLKLIGFTLLIPIIGAISALFFEAPDFYKELVKPPLAPPGWIFGIAWTILYALLGATLYYIVKNKDQKSLLFYISQLAINFIWSFVFFNFQMFILAYVMILIILGLTIALFYINRKSKFICLLIPYILWLMFASYLNLGIIVLN